MGSVVKNVLPFLSLEIRAVLTNGLTYFTSLLKEYKRYHSLPLSPTYDQLLL